MPLSRVCSPITLALVFGSMAAALFLHPPKAEARQCEWRGTAPTCKGTSKDCRADEDYVDLGGKVEQTDTKNTLAKFGKPCIFGGFKVLCCKKEATAPAPAQKLTEPTAEFCNWYAAEAVARAGQGAKCGLTGARWDPNKQGHYDWCIQKKSQQQGWSEHNARLAALADCAKKEAASAPPKANQSAGAPVVTVPQDVDVYKDPGVGQPFGVLRKASRPQVYERRPDQWCFVAGNSVPDGRGWVWCGKGFELE